MTVKTLIATAAAVLAFAPAASAVPLVENGPASPQQAKWQAYDAGAAAAYAPPAAPARSLPPVAPTSDPIPTAGRVALVLMVLFVAGAIVIVRRRDAVRTATAAGWDM